MEVEDVAVWSLTLIEGVMVYVDQTEFNTLSLGSMSNMKLDYNDINVKL